MKNFTRVPNIVIHANTLTPFEFRILLILLSFPDGQIYPSIDYLVKTSNLSKSTIIRSLKSLKDKSVISWKSGNHIKKQANYYKINEEKYWKIWPKTPPTEELTGVQQTPTGVCQTQNRCLSEAPLRLININSEPNEIENYAAIKAAVKTSPKFKDWLSKRLAKNSLSQIKAESRDLALVTGIWFLEKVAPPGFNQDLSTLDGLDEHECAKLFKKHLEEFKCPITNASLGGTSDINRSI